jgi:hypothetical protein
MWSTPGRGLDSPPPVPAPRSVRVDGGRCTDSGSDDRDERQQRQQPGDEPEQDAGPRRTGIGGRAILDQEQTKGTAPHRSNRAAEGNDVADDQHEPDQQGHHRKDQSCGTPPVPWPLVGSPPLPPAPMLGSGSAPVRRDLPVSCQTPVDRRLTRHRAQLPLDQLEPQPARPHEGCARRSSSTATSAAEPIWCGHDRGRCDRSTNASRPPPSYLASHSCTVCRRTPNRAATSVTVSPSLITASTA